MAIQNADALGMNSPPNPRGETVVLKAAWNSPTSSTLRWVLLYSHSIKTRANR